MMRSLTARAVLQVKAQTCASRVRARGAQTAKIKAESSTVRRLHAGRWVPLVCLIEPQITRPSGSHDYGLAQLQMTVIMFAADSASGQRP